MKRTAYSPHIGIYVQGLKTTVKNNMSVQHYHDAYEIYFQTNGTRYTFFDNFCYTLKRGDIAVFKPFELHYARSEECEYYERYVVNFSKDSFSGILTDSEIYMLFEKLESGIIHLDEEQTIRLEKLFALAEENAVKTGFLADKLLSGAVLQIIASVAEYKSIQANAESINPQIAKAIRYIEKNYSNAVELEKIADFAGLSKYHFSRLFSKVTGASAIEYLINVRLSKVHSLLLSTQDSITEIAIQTGFSSADNLSRVFKKKYGIA